MKFTTTFKKISQMQHRIKVIQGSKGSSKTYSVLQKRILKALIRDKKHLSSIITDTMPNLRRGALKDFETICVENHINYKRTKNPYIYRIGSTTFEFLAIDKEEKALGARRDSLYLNEANRIGWKTARHLIGYTNGEVDIDFNPVNSFWAHEHYVSKGLCDFIKVTYKDNEYLPAAQRESIEMYAPQGSNPDENYWRVYGLGEIGFTEGVIFKNWKEYDTIEGNLPKMIGVDFGWEDPLAAVMAHIDKKNKRLYWREIAYGSHMNYDDLCTKIRNDPEYNGCYLICDHLPRDIRELKKRGLKALGADKRNGLETEIRLLKQYEIFIHKDSKNLKREMNSYQYQQIKGEFIDYPKDENNHAIDAGKYPSIVLMN